MGVIDLQYFNRRRLNTQCPLQSKKKQGFGLELVGYLVLEFLVVKRKGKAING
jgi:hypothetical protein